MDYNAPGQRAEEKEKNVDQIEEAPQSISDLRPKMRLQGVVKETQLYGAVIDIGLERNGLAHISQLAPKRVQKVTDIVKAGDEVTVWVTKVDEEKGRIGVSLIKPPAVEWNEVKDGAVYSGTVTRIEPYGVFVEIGAGRPGLVHIREMSDGFIRHPSELVKMGDTLSVSVLKVDRQKRRIELTLRNTEDEIDMGEDEQEQVPQKTAMEMAIEKAAGGSQPHRRRRKKSQPPDRSEAEAILARTLREHSGS